MTRLEGFDGTRTIREKERETRWCRLTTVAGGVRKRMARQRALTNERTNERTGERNERTNERTTGAEKSNKQKMKAGLDRSIARAGLYIDSRGVYETTRRGEGRRGERGGKRMTERHNGGLDGTDRESGDAEVFLFFFFSRRMK